MLLENEAKKVNWKKLFLELESEVGPSVELYR